MDGDVGPRMSGRRAAGIPATPLPDSRASRASPAGDVHALAAGPRHHGRATRRTPGKKRCYRKPGIRKILRVSGKKAKLS
uniref:Uncharacterized protein n=1 Tax=Oryza sativa subsp. japonica TaxID=39947 RepID=Q8LMJ5_ORYSJ|nr:hypothetical protein [Oryza sativa Japonica Group]